MKLLALGGSGGMGQYAVRAALSYDFVDSVVIADRNEEAARAFAEACGPKATAAQIDVTDTARLIELMSESDIVMNTVGPYFRFGIPVLKAAIAAKRDYIDICDDWEPTLEMLDLDASARDAGIVAVIGVGASPGASNMLAVCAARELDTVTSLITGWDLDGASPEPPEPGAGPSAATIHGIEQLTGTIRNLRDGAFVDDSPIKKFRIDYPGSGQHSVWSIGHPEPVTLPRKYPSLETCVNVMSTGPATIFGMRALAWLVNRGLASRERVASWVERGGRTGETDTQSITESLAAGTWKKPPPLFALAEGLRDGETVRVGAMLTAAPEGGMGGATGVPLAVGVALIHEMARQAGGQTTERCPGVHAPEAAFNADRFFELLGAHCAPRRATAADLALVTRSWEPASLIEEFRKLG